MEAATNKGIDVGGVINETFKVYGANLAGLLGSAAAIFIIVGLVQAVLWDAGSALSYFIAIAVGFAAQALYTGFVVKLVEDVRDGRRDFSAGQLLSSATGAIVPLLINGVLLGIAVAIGFILLIVPGLFLLTIWAVTAPSIVIERESAIGAFGRSRELVRGNGWSVFGVILIAFLIGFGISFVLSALGGGMGLGGAIVLGTVAEILTAPIAGLVSAILFFDLGGGAAPESDQDPLAI